MQGGIINVSWQEVLVDVSFVRGHCGAYRDKQLGICLSAVPRQCYAFFFSLSPMMLCKGVKKKTYDLGTAVNHIHLQVFKYFFSQIPQMLVPSFMIQVYVSFTM